MTPATKVLRVRANDDHDARLRVAAALGGDAEFDVQPIKETNEKPEMKP